ncbi:hypothetical protein DFH09DRAFT_1478157 [Mycena vulgaris]|nr:hypothetical protein DFH09DRAFT_1478157 [Mycena vulgaris]
MSMILRHSSVLCRASSPALLLSPSLVVLPGAYFHHHISPVCLLAYSRLLKAHSSCVMQPARLLVQATHDAPLLKTALPKRASFSLLFGLAPWGPWSVKARPLPARPPGPGPRRTLQARTFRAWGARLLVQATHDAPLLKTALPKLRQGSSRAKLHDLLLAYESSRRWARLRPRADLVHGIKGLVERGALPGLCAR